MAASESSRMWASASFVGVLIIIGLPLWWKTTEVYRVPLPYDVIASFGDQSPTIGSELTILAYDKTTLDEVAGLVEKSFENVGIIKLNITKGLLSESLKKTLDSSADEQSAMDALARELDLGKINTFHLVQNREMKTDVWLGGHRAAMFKDATVAPSLVTLLKQSIYQLSTLDGARITSPDVSRRSRIPPAPAYRIVLSVVVPKPDEVTVDFDAREAVEDYIGTFVDEMEDLHNFTLKSQWIYLLDYDFQAKQMKESAEHGPHFAVQKDSLHSLLTKIEERAASQSSELPSISLVLYAVPCSKAPLLIYNGDSPMPLSVQSFWSPRWGGVVLASPSQEECSHDPAQFRPGVREIMGAFVSHLRPILGLHDGGPVPGVFVRPLRSVVPRAWELDALRRTRAVEQLTLAQSTLHSLAKLLEEIPNIVINDLVGASVQSGVQSIARGEQELRRGRLREGGAQAAEASAHAASAAHHPSLLALLYFPHDQKYAIYIPLFLPIMFPVVLSLKNLILWLRGKPINKEKTD